MSECCLGVTKDILEPEAKHRMLPEVDLGQYNWSPCTGRQAGHCSYDIVHTQNRRQRRGHQILALHRALLKFGRPKSTSDGATYSKLDWELNFTSLIVIGLYPST